MSSFSVQVGREENCHFYILEVHNCEKFLEESAWLQALKRHHKDGEIIRLPETEPKVFEYIINKVNGIDPVKELNSEIISEEEDWNVIYQAHEWLLDNVVDMCCDDIWKSVKDNFATIFDRISMLDLSNRLETDSQFLIQWNLRNLLTTKVHLGWSYFSWLKLLPSNNLDCEEISLFIAFQEWKNHNTPTQRVLKMLIPFIRFPSISEKDFDEIVVPSGILDENLVLKMKQFYKSPTLNTGFNHIPRRFDLGINDGVDF